MTVESEDKPEAVSALPAGAEGALATLIDSVKSLSAEVKSIREETKELREVVIPPRRTVAAAADTGSVPVATVASPPVPTRVTLPELRAMTDLASSVDRRVAQLGLASSSDSSESAGDSAMKTSRAKVSKSRPRGGKLKSGKDAKPTSAVRFPQFWPHSFLCVTRSQREASYEELSMAEFVTGYAQILQSREISAFERSERQKHLVSLMYFVQQFEWKAVLSFHGAVLLEIERGLVTWGDSFMYLESRTLYGHLILGKAS